MLVALKLTAAFDNVDHQQLLDCVFNNNIPSTIRHWLYNYMQNRRAKVHFLQKESKSRKVKTGVVQGGVLSPALFNYYLADFPTPPPNIKYADDITIYTSGPVVADLINGLNIYLSQVLNYIKKDSVNGQIYSNTFHARYLHPQVKLADQVLPLKKKPKVLGMTLDTHLTFTPYCNNIAVKVLKALGGSTWGCGKETLLTTYQTIGCSLLIYCSPVWTPPLTHTNWCRLQRAQNYALRISTGCFKMADVTELHQEAQEQAVHQHTS